MHIPLQAGTDKILKAMNRKYDTKYFKEKIDKIRTIRPDISISTDVIVGFPGETEEDFIESMDFINSMKFSKIHVFPYSKREGTKAATFDNQVDEKVKKDRARLLIKLSKKLEIEYMDKFMGKEVSFIPEVSDNGFVYGHTGNYLYVKANDTSDDLKKNKIVEIIDIDYPYVIGK